MKYFTPELIDLLSSSDDDVVDAAEVEWERRLEHYERDLQLIEPELPPHIREFNGLLLHDARVYSLARQGDRLIIVLRKDIPPRDLVVITYALTEEPLIDREALSPKERSPVMDYLYNEFRLVQDGASRIFEESILFGNGWEVQLRFRDVQFTLAEPIYPLPGTTGTPTGQAFEVESA